LGIEIPVQLSADLRLAPIHIFQQEETSLPNPEPQNLLHNAAILLFTDIHSHFDLTAGQFAPVQHKGELSVQIHFSFSAGYLFQFCDDHSSSSCSWIRSIRLSAGIS